MALEVQELNCSDILYDDTFNCRGEVDPRGVVELADSIKASGLIQHVTVEETPEGVLPYRLIAGHRRFIAISKVLEWALIPAIVRNGLTPEECHKLNLQENLARADLTPTQELRGILAIYGRYPVATQVAKDLNRSISWVRARLNIRKLEPSLQKDLDEGLLNACDVALLITTPADSRYNLARQIKAARLNSRPSPRSRMGTRSGKRTMKECKAMLAYFVTKGTRPDGLKALAWASGAIDDEELTNPCNAPDGIP